MSLKRESTGYRGLPTPPEEDAIIYLVPKREDCKPNIIKGNTRATTQNGLPVERPGGQSGGGSHDVNSNQSAGQQHLAARGSLHRDLIL
jgi:hypothetical protein